jgi:adenylyltransferase/sulfurtransferase
VLFDQADVGRPKAAAAAARLREINPDVTIEAIADDFRASNAEQYAADVHLLIDGLDNFATRYLLNDLAVKHGVPYIYAGAVGTSGLVMPILPRGGGLEEGVMWDDTQATPCLRCVFPEPPPVGSTPTCDTAGVLGPAIAAVTAQQAAIAMSLIVGRLHGFDRSMHSLDPWRGEDRRMDTGLPRDDCRCCSDRIFDWLEGSPHVHEETMCGRSSVQILPTRPEAIDLELLADRLESHGVVAHADGALQVDLAREGVRITIFQDSRALIGVEDPVQARTLYDRFVGS